MSDTQRAVKLMRWPLRLLDASGEVLAAARLQHAIDTARRETLQACRESAAKAKKSVRCTIEVKPENNAR